MATVSVIMATLCVVENASTNRLCSNNNTEYYILLGGGLIANFVCSNGNTEFLKGRTLLRRLLDVHTASPLRERYSIICGQDGATLIGTECSKVTEQNYAQRQFYRIGEAADESCASIVI